MSNSPNVSGPLMLICIKLSKLDLMAEALGGMQIKFITENPVSKFFQNCMGIWL